MPINNPRGGTMAVYFDPSSPAVGATFSGSMAVYYSGSEPTIKVKTGSTIAVYFDPAVPSVAATFSGTMATYFDQSNPAVTAYTLDGTTKRALRGNSDGAIKVYDIADGSIVVRSITNSAAVHILSTGGTLAVKIDPGYNVVNTSSTIVIPQNSSGSYNGVSVSGATLAGPTAGRVLKVFGIALTTTAQVGIVAKFTNGAGTGPTEYRRYALQAPAQGIAGANIAVSPPAYLFASSSGGTISLVLDSASLVHYTIDYFEESA